MKLTIDQKNKLHELAFASVTNREIAEQMGLPISEVYAQRSQMGITRDKVALAKGEVPRAVMAKHIPLKKARKPTYTFEDVTPKNGESNKALTLDELQNMCGEPVYMVDKKCTKKSGWCIVEKHYDGTVALFMPDNTYYTYAIATGAIAVYCRKTEEASHY